MKMTGPFWVYTITTPDNDVYTGMSSRKDTQLRWQQSLYRSTSLGPYIEKYGWENLQFFFIDGIKDEYSAIKLEDELILMYRKMGCSINKNRSGGVWSVDGKRKYDNNWYHENIEYARERSRKWRNNNLEKERARDRARYYKKKNEKNNKPTKSEKEKMRKLAKLYMDNKKMERQLKKNGYISLF